MGTENRTPGQVARDMIDRLLTAAGWEIQSKDGMSVYASPASGLRSVP